MKAEELMIGNYMKHGFGGIGKVTELSKGIVTVYDKGFDDGEGNCEVNFAENEIHPIPLTPEILEKNGFKKDTGGEECWSSKIGWLTPHEYDDNFKEKSWEVELFGKPNSFDGVITYVHELQHILRLCEIDKEIEL